MYCIKDRSVVLEADVSLIETRDSLERHTICVCVVRQECSGDTR
jgi:hypothetical protein